MRLRRFIKRALKPFVMVGLVGTLSVSLIVTTPSNAQAFVPPPVLPAVWGATTMAIPSLMPTAAVLGPVGWGILGVTALGVGLYATKDYWLPYVTGTFGGSEQSSTPLTGKTSHTVMKPPWEPGQNALTITYVNNGVPAGGSGGWYAHFGVIGKCKNNTTGAVGYKHVGGYWSYGNNPPAAWTNNITLTPCPGGTTMTGWVVGGGNPGGTPEFTPNLNTSEPWPARFDHLSSQYNFATKNLEWGGDMLEKAFDPRGAGTTYRTETECIAPDGTYSTVTATSQGDEGGVKMASCDAAGKGHGTGKVTVWATPPDGSPEKKLWETQRATEDPAQPLCSPSRPSSGCKLGVSLDGQPCVVGNPLCENWSDVRNDPNYSTRLSCQYGPYQVSMETCNPLERAYEPGGAPATEPNVDGNPGTRNDTQPDGSTAPRPKTDPNAPPIPGGAATAPVPGSTTQQAECFPTGWGLLNPIEWVMKPVGCALDAAFKPKKDLQARLAGMQGQFTNKVPVSWFGVGIQGASGGGCPADWAVNYDGHRYSLICGTEADNIIRGFRPVLGAMLVMAMLWPFIRSLFYAAIPVFKVTPS